MMRDFYRIAGIEKFFPLILLLCVSLSGVAQKKGLVTGKVLDSISSSPMGYTSIAVYSAGDKKLVNGNISDDEGDFRIEVPYGRYYTEVNFLGFHTYRTEAFTISAEESEHDLGNIKLQPEVDVLEEVVVQGEKSTMELSLDKKIFNVGKDLANSGGNATDVLMNIPSVAVDPEGNVKLRGSSSVRILIDGKPSGLVSFKGGSGLQQLQASMIERVEVITNPSARYEAEGMGGVINIVLKKETNQGFNGSIDVITGHPANYGLAANLNYRHKRVNFFINYGLSYRDQPGVGSMYQEFYRNDSTFILQQDTDSKIKGLNNNIRGGIDLFFSETSILTGAYLFRRSDATRVTNIRYNDYLFSLSNPQGYSTRRQDEEETEPNSEYSLIYKKIFQGKDHEFLAEVKYLDNWESSDQTFTEHFYDNDGTEDPSKASLEKSLNDESEKQFLVQIDYTRPFMKEGKFETGFRTSSRNMYNDFIVTRQNSEGAFEPLPGLDNIFYYDERITAAYGILANKSKGISYQAGVRAEWSDIETRLEETGEVNPRNYVNLFPSAHLTFDLPKENAIQVSFSRRIRRPFYNDLSPFFTYSDRRNYFSGNPDLNPEYSNVYEIGHIKYFNIGTVSSAIYHRNSQDKIDQIRTLDDDGNAVTVPENLNSELAYGLEFAATLALTKWWKFDANFNFFYSEIDGSNIDPIYTTTTYSWFSRQTSRFSLPGNMDFQVRTNYEAPQNTAQGKRKGLYYVDLSLVKDILKGNGTLNLTVLDLFNSRVMRTITEGPTFYTDRDNQFRRRQVNLTFSYRIKQSKPVGKPKGEGDEF